MTSPTVLIIEDDTILRSVFVEIVEFAGARALAAANGITGLGIALHQRPNIILSDIDIPGLSGYEIFNILQKSGSLQHSHFVFVTASDPLEVCQKTGVSRDQVLQKPIAVDHFLDLLIHCL